MLYYVYMYVSAYINRAMTSVANAIDMLNNKLQPVNTFEYDMQLTPFYPYDNPNI